MPASPRTALFVSPHLDDVAFSCGGTVAGLRRLGWRVVVATVFTRSVLNPIGFALACQLDKGLAPDVDYMALRRAEDAEFGRALGVDRLAWLDLPEAPHRGYDSAPALFAGVRPDDDGIVPEIGARLGPLIDEVRPAWIFAPQGVGNHADHRQVIRSLNRLGRPVPIAWYRDLPYASKFPAAQPAPDLPAGRTEVAFPLQTADLAAKVGGSACYATQVPFQFGSGSAIEPILGDFARAEGRRLGGRGPVESFLCPPAPDPAPAAADDWWDRGAGSFRG